MYNQWSRRKNLEKVIFSLGALPAGKLSNETGGIGELCASPGENSMRKFERGDKGSHEAGAERKLDRFKL